MFNGKEIRHTSSTVPIHAVTVQGMEKIAGFCTIFAHNVSFSVNLGNLPEILFGQISSVWCVDLWNRTEISIDCHIARG